MDKVFLYRIKDSDDRDCCAYIDNNPMRFECGHYFGRPILHGSCYCNSDWKNYDEIETVLTESEYKALIQFDAAIGSLGYGIDKDSERYQKGMKLCKEIQAVYDKLNGEEAKVFYQKIITEEKRIVMDEYDMTEEQVEAAFNNYPLNHDYQDRSIIGSVFDDASDLGYEEAFSLGYIKKDDYISEKYFDYEKFDNDLLEQEEYYELDDGRCIYYMM